MLPASGEEFAAETAPLSGTDALTSIDELFEVDDVDEALASRIMWPTLPTVPRKDFVGDC